jgi:Flp pilus assembly protein TadB
MASLSSEAEPQHSESRSPSLRSAAGDRPPSGRSTRSMLTLAIILLVLWALGFITSYTMGGLIHILLVVAIVIILVRVIRGQKVL